MVQPLSTKHENFCLNYVQSNNQTQAAIEAGYSPISAAGTAVEILKNPQVIARIQELRSKIADPTIMSVRKRKQRLTEVALSNLNPESIQPGHVMQAIDLLNKMDKIYSDGATIQDNRQVNIYTTDKLAEGALKALMSGERPQLSQSTDIIDP